MLILNFCIFVEIIEVHACKLQFLQKANNVRKLGAVLSSRATKSSNTRGWLSNRQSVRTFATFQQIFVHFPTHCLKIVRNPLLSNIFLILDCVQRILKNIFVYLQTTVWFKMCDAIFVFKFTVFCLSKVRTEINSAPNLNTRLFVV